MRLPVLVALLLPMSLFAAQPPSDARIRLIVKGDDMGVAHGVNVATIRAYTEGVLTTTNVIMPGPWMLEAAAMLAEHPDLDVGVHLTITSEWERVKWRPITRAASLVDADGYFFPMVQPRPGFPPNTSVKEAAPDLKEIEAEVRAQLELAKRHIPRVTYTWAHMGFTSLSPEVRALVSKLTAEYGLVEPIARFKPQFLGRVYEQLDSGELKADRLAARLETLGPGLWLTVDHAATDTPEVQAIGHKGYEQVAADRSAVLAAWTSPKVKAVIERRGIELTDYRKLLN